MEEYVSEDDEDNIDVGGSASSPDLSSSHWGDAPAPHRWGYAPAPHWEGQKWVKNEAPDDDSDSERLVIGDDGEAQQNSQVSEFFLCWKFFPEFKLWQKFFYRQKKMYWKFSWI